MIWNWPWARRPDRTAEPAERKTGDGRGFVALHAQGEAVWTRDELIMLGMGLLRLAPRDFWTMTPREAALVMRLVSGGTTEPPWRAALEELMRQLPDERKIR